MMFPLPPKDIFNFESLSLASFSIKITSDLISSYKKISIDLQKSSVVCFAFNFAHFFASSEVSFSNLLNIFLIIKKNIFF